MAEDEEEANSGLEDELMTTTGQLVEVLRIVSRLNTCSNQKRTHIM